MSSVARDYRVELPSFEGPLDLLLHLVKKHELDILSIPVSFITERYLAYLELMRQLNLEVAGEYLLMAATLAHMKSRELIPTPDPLPADEHEDGEEGADPRMELIGRLLEYQKYKEAADSLGNRPVVGRNVWTRGGPVDGVLPDEVNAAAEAPLADVPVFRLIEVLSDVLSKARVKLTHDVLVERLSIAERIQELVDRLDTEGTFGFRTCFAFLESEAEMGEAQLKHQVVITFLAILEMAKLKLIRIEQPEEGIDIHITRAVPDIKNKAKDSALDPRSLP